MQDDFLNIETVNMDDTIELTITGPNAGVVAYWERYAAQFPVDAFETTLVGSRQVTGKVLQFVITRRTSPKPV